MPLLVLFLFDQQSKDRRNIFGEYIKQTAHISVVFLNMIKRFYAYEENLSVIWLFEIKITAQTAHKPWSNAVNWKLLWSTPAVNDAGLQATSTGDLEEMQLFSLLFFF